MHEGIVLCCLIVEPKGRWCYHEHFIGALSGPSLHGFDAILLGCSSNIWHCTDLDALSAKQPEEEIFDLKQSSKTCTSVQKEGTCCTCSWDPPVASDSPQQIGGNVREAVHAVCRVSDILVHHYALWLKSSSAVHSYLSLSQRRYSCMQRILASVEGCEGISQNANASRAAGFCKSARLLLNSCSEITGLPCQHDATLTWHSVKRQRS